jgi:hypothetical protein
LIFSAAGQNRAIQRFITKIALNLGPGYTPGRHELMQLHLYNNILAVESGSCHFADWIAAFYSSVQVGDQKQSNSWRKAGRSILVRSPEYGSGLNCGRSVTLASSDR